MRFCYEMLSSFFQILFPSCLGLWVRLHAIQQVFGTVEALQTLMAPSIRCTAYPPLHVIIERMVPKINLDPPPALGGVFEQELGTDGIGNPLMHRSLAYVSSCSPAVCPPHRIPSQDTASNVFTRGLSSLAKTRTDVTSNLLHLLKYSLGSRISPSPSD